MNKDGKLKLMFILIISIGIFSIVACVSVNEDIRNDCYVIIDDIIEDKGYDVSSVTYHEGIKLTYLVGADNENLYITNYDNATNPTYEELKTFLYEDKTDEIEYDLSTFVCADYAEKVHNNAEKAGIKSGLVLIDLDNGIRHSFNMFNTTDKGIVYIDCTQSLNCENSDKIIPVLREGEPYIPEPIFNLEYYYTSMGTIEKIRTFW